MIDTVKIGPITYTVKEADDLHSVDGDGKKLILHGDIRWGKAEIRIDSDQTDDVKLTTLWHEVIHGILNKAGITDHPENVVIALGYGLVQFLRDNPTLVNETIYPPGGR